MKHFKNGLPILALVLAVAASAFTSKPDTDTYYFRFVPNSESAGLLEESNYESIESPSGQNCTGGDLNCVIELSTPPDMQGHPDFDAAGITSESQLDAVTIAWKP